MSVAPFALLALRTLEAEPIHVCRDTAGRLFFDANPARNVAAAMRALEELLPVAEAAANLLAFVKERHPEDFAPGAAGFTCPKMRALDDAVERLR